MCNAHINLLYGDRLRWLHTTAAIHGTWSSSVSINESVQDDEKCSEEVKTKTKATVYATSHTST